MFSACFYEKGPVRPVNQDALALEEVKIGSSDCLLAIVCDGIGGLSEGEYASSFVSGQARNWFYEEYIPLKLKRGTQERIMNSARRMLYECNHSLKRYAREKGIQLGTTATMVLISGHKYLLLHIGDSRAYVFRQSLFTEKIATNRSGNIFARGRTEQITRDHNLTDGTLTRCIGSFPWSELQVKRGILRKNQTMLLCTDGFRKRMEPQELRTAFMGKELSEQQLLKRLKKLGQENIDRGEKDNQAAIVVRRGKR